MFTPKSNSKQKYAKREQEREIGEAVTGLLASRMINPNLCFNSAPRSPQIDSSSFPFNTLVLLFTSFSLYLSLSLGKCFVK
ncbi:transmembrane protein, putative [Medicago truncatula]|uniref:Transmembrane protein, putative n=1 Tax=Medicago truncatula TaxID=3880 RepID=A0A072UU64_MEDTR|nr:transmembrane protein, putative [Medicago truncatula]